MTCNFGNCWAEATRHVERHFEPHRGGARSVISQECNGHADVRRSDRVTISYSRPLKPAA